MLAVTEELLSELGLARAAELLGATIWAATQQDASYLDFITTLLGIEREERRQRSYETRLRLAGLPHRKGLGDFDFATGVDRSLVNELASCAFVANAVNVVLLGPPGVGKSHLAVGLALRALEVGHSVYFATMHRMVADLETMGSPRRLRKYLAPKVVGYRALSHAAAGIFFEVISARYETGSIIATSNKGSREWGTLVGDPVLATAILNRLLHHATVLNISGESYRLRERTKQPLPGGLLPQAATAMAKGGEAEHHDPAGYRLCCVPGGSGLAADPGCVHGSGVLSRVALGP